MLLYRNGTKYIGNFLDGNKHGLGRCEYNDGGEYYGHWAEGRKSGQGECICSYRSYRIGLIVM